MWPPGTLRNKTASPSQDFAPRNGEILLRTQISFPQGQSNPIRTFTLRELQQATHDFDQSRRLASTLYWGILNDRKVVIKNGNWIWGSYVGERLVKAHITEIVVLSNIRHKNVVKLLGCCLETQVPLLVYEFIPKGNLCHNMKLWYTRVEPGAWSTRFQIALDVADALSYLHSYTARPIVHKKVQATSIILDDDNTAKLAGFSYSVPIPPGGTLPGEDEDLIRGTYGFYDPEYVATGRLTEKADVYAFGVLLLELLTGTKFSSYLRREENVVLVEVLVLEKDDLSEGSPVNPLQSTISVEVRRKKYLALKEECLAKLVVDANALGYAEGTTEQLRAFAELALQCVLRKILERPSMKEVVEVLRRIKSLSLP